MILNRVNLENPVTLSKVAQNFMIHRRSMILEFNGWSSSTIFLCDVRRRVG